LGLDHWERSNLPKVQPSSGGIGSGFSQAAQPLAIVAAVMIFGASIYLWRRHYLRSRAGLITIAAIIGALLYFGIFYQRPAI
jgi:hypothetical protein